MQMIYNWFFYQNPSYDSNVYLTDVASREATHAASDFLPFSVFKKMMDSMFGPACYFYLDDLISEDFITLLLFCWDVWRQTSALLIIHQQLHNERHLTPTGRLNSVF